MQNNFIEHLCDLFYHCHSSRRTRELREKVTDRIIIPTYERRNEIFFSKVIVRVWKNSTIKRIYSNILYDELVSWLTILFEKRNELSIYHSLFIFSLNERNREKILKFKSNFFFFFLDIFINFDIKICLYLLILLLNK